MTLKVHDDASKAKNRRPPILQATTATSRRRRLASRLVVVVSSLSRPASRREEEESRSKPKRERNYYWRGERKRAFSSAAFAPLSNGFASKLFNPFFSKNCISHKIHKGEKSL